MKIKLKLVHRLSFTALSAILIFMLAITMQFLSAAPVMAQSVTISPSSGSPGTTTTVSGSGFNDGDTYQIIFAPGTIYEEVLAPTTIISGTSFSRIITIPSATWGQHTIRVASNRGNFSLTFTVSSSIELTTNTGYVGDTVTVTGVGFRANTTISIVFNNRSILTTQSNIYGELNPVDFQVPTIPRGNYNVYGSDSIASSPNVIFTIRPHLAISPQEGSVGSQINLAGTGFGASSAITIYWGSSIVSSNQITTSSSGSFSATLVVPAGSRGSHSISARDSGLATDSASFLVKPNIIISPGSGAPGTIVSVNGKGFRSNTVVQITFRGATVSTQPPNVTTDSDGSFSASFTMPASIAGSYTVGASDGVYSATASFSVISSIQLSPSTGHVGADLLVSGTGFTPDGKVTLTYDNQAIITVTTSSVGSFSLTFSVPVSRAGQHVVTALDLTTQGVTASANFTMESTPPPVPNLLTPQSGSQTDVQTRFSWSAASDTSGVTYDLQVARGSNFSSLLLFKQGLTQTEYQVGQSEALQLTKKTNSYYWRVRAVDGAGNASDWASPDSFYTQDSTPPGQPMVFGPQNDSQVDIRPVFSWSAVSDSSGVTYDLQVARGSNFSSLLLFKQGLTQTEYQVGQSEALQLTKKTNPYYWRVRAVDGAGNASDWTTPNLVYTDDSTPPPAPVSLRPENDSQKRGNVLFNWTAVSDPSGVTYTLEVAQDSDFNHIIIYKEGLDTSEYQLTKMEELSSTTGNPPNPYYWRVRAVDGAQNQSNWTTASAFYVGGFLHGWPLYIIMAIVGILLIAVGILIGMRIRPSSSQGS